MYLVKDMRRCVSFVTRKGQPCSIANMNLHLQMNRLRKLTAQIHNSSGVIFKQVCSGKFAHEVPDVNGFGKSSFPTAAAGTSCVNREVDALLSVDNLRTVVGGVPPLPSCSSNGVQNEMQKLFPCATGCDGKQVTSSTFASMPSCRSERPVAGLPFFCSDARQRQLLTMTMRGWRSFPSDLRNYAKGRVKTKTKSKKVKGGKGGGQVEQDEDGDDEEDSSSPSRHVDEQQSGKKKGNKSTHGGESGGTTGNIKAAVESVKTQMNQALDSFTDELARLRSGRPNPSLLNHLMVPYGDSGPFPLNSIATVTVRDSQTLGVLVYDPNMLNAVEKAIMDSPGGLFPKRTEDGFLVPLPRMTTELREVVSKEAIRAAENAKVRVRRVRKDGLDAVKKSLTGVSEDDVKRQEKEIDEVTKDFVNKIAVLCKAKEKELMLG